MPGRGGDLFCSDGFVSLLVLWGGGGDLPGNSGPPGNVGTGGYVEMSKTIKLFPRKLM